MLDVDGTLMHRGSWNPGAKDLINLLVDHGMKVALCSGRSTASLIALSREVPAVSIIASSSGATALARESDDPHAQWRVLGHRPLPPQVLDNALNVADRCGIEAWAYTAREWMLRTVTDRARFEESFVHDSPRIDPLVGRSDIGKVLFLVERSGDRESLQEIDHWDGVGLVMSGGVYADLIPEVAVRTKGGDMLIDHLGIGWDDVLAIGDGQNDIGMLSLAGHAMCVDGLATDRLDPASPIQQRAHAATTADALEIAREWYSAPVNQEEAR